MAKFKKGGGKGLPAISTASLPDIIFILLFFFMVATVLRDKTLKVKNILPTATEIVKLKKKSLAHNIFVGPPIPKYEAILGDAPRIQLDDKFADVEDIQKFISKEREATADKLVPFLTTNLKVHNETKMGIITDIKQELRKANQLKLNYSATQRVKDL